MSLATELVTLLLHYIVPPPEEIRRLHVALSPDMFDAASRTMRFLDTSAT